MAAFGADAASTQRQSPDGSAMAPLRHALSLWERADGVSGMTTFSIFTAKGAENAEVRREIFLLASAGTLRSLRLYRECFSQRKSGHIGLRCLSSKRKQL